MAYMNAAQPDSLATIAAAACPHRVVRGASVAGFDGEGVDLVVAFGDGRSTLRVEWLRSISERYEIRGQFVALLEHALDALSAD